MRVKRDSFDSPSGGAGRIIAGCVITLFAITAVLGIVLMVNQDKLNNKNRKQSVVKIDEEISDNFVKTESGLTAGDLDFWDMYEADDTDPNRTTQYSMNNKNSVSSNKEKYDRYEEKENEIEEENKKENIKESNVISSNEISANSISENSVSDNTFNASDTDEPLEVTILDNVTKNNFTASNFRQENEKLQYFTANRKTSSFGIDLSKYQGTVDWEKVKNSGVEFAMIRMGVRGYSSGTVVMDEKFVENMEGATKNGIDIGIYFYSQATTPIEAIEEANYAVAAAAPYKLTYPIVFYTENIANDSARTDNLTKTELTDIAIAFCDTVKGYGYKSMICGSKQRLSTSMELTRLSNYDVWLIDVPYNGEGKKLTVSEYPYQYAMWQYSATGKVDGISGNADLDISFVDYKYR